MPSCRFRIATWNINSLRRRKQCLPALIAALRPDVFCLQETKVPDTLFPVRLAQELGFPYVARRGMKSYNGVALFSRLPFRVLADTPDWCGKHDCRHLAVVFDLSQRFLTLHDFYVPAGGDKPDPETNAKFAHKLAFLAEARAHFATHPPHRTVLVGDLNVAPCENDVWNHRRLLRVVSHTPVETTALKAWRATGFTDAIRHLLPKGERVFTWWSYRNQDWHKSNRGRRLDHIWVSNDLVASLRSEAVLTEARDWALASDHVPVCAELAL